MGHTWATHGPTLQNTCGPHVCLRWKPFQLPHVGLVWPTCGMFAGTGPFKALGVVSNLTGKALQRCKGTMLLAGV